jgi:hypothetical protein
MSKKRAKKVNAVKEERTTKAVRLDLNPTDHGRLERCARERGLNMSSYARMAVLKLIKEDESQNS